MSTEIVVSGKDIRSAIGLLFFGWEGLAVGVILDDVGHFEHEESSEGSPALQVEHPVIPLRGDHCSVVELLGAVQPRNVASVGSLPFERAVLRGIIAPLPGPLELPSVIIGVVILVGLIPAVLLAIAGPPIVVVGTVRVPIV